MNILIAPPNDNFDLDAMKKLFNNDVTFKDDQLFFDDQQLTQNDLEAIDVFVGFNKQLLDTILNDDNSNLKFIQALSVGIDYLPTDLIKQRGIKLATVNGIHQEPIAESVIGMILGQYRQVEKYANIDKWQALSVPMKVVDGKTAVLFGTGSIGKRIAELLKPFHVRTIGVNTRGHAVDFFDKTVPTNELDNDVFNADMIINSLPLNNATANLFDAELFNQFTKQPMFINVGRGGSVNTNDMINALKTNRLGAVSVDVIDPEPLPDDSEIWDLDNAYVSPHISATYDEFLTNSLKLFDQNFNQFKKDGTLSLNELTL